MTTFVALKAYRDTHTLALARTYARPFRRVFELPGSRRGLRSGRLACAYSSSFFSSCRHVRLNRLCFQLRPPIAPRSHAHAPAADMHLRVQRARRRRCYESGCPGVIDPPFPLANAFPPVRWPFSRLLLVFRRLHLLSPSARPSVGATCLPVKGTRGSAAASVYITALRAHRLNYTLR